MRKGFFLIFLVMIASVASAAPKMLIVQKKWTVSNDQDPNYPLGAPIQKELSDDGRVDPILADPKNLVYQAAMNGALLGDQPSIDQAKRAAKAVGAEYLLVFVTTKGAEGMLVEGELYRHGRSVWKDSKKMSVSVGAVIDWGGLGNTVARTWVTDWRQGVLKGLKRQQKIGTPEPEPGVLPIAPPVNPPQVRPKATDEQIGKAKTYLDKGQISEAINVLRDAVDASPLDSALRAMLVELLTYQGFPEQGAVEARRAAALLPEELEFRLYAARALLLIGKSDEAQAEVNEALARAPDEVATQVLLGEVLLSKGEYKKASEAFTNAMLKQESLDARIGRATAYAFSGEFDLCEQDLQSTKSLDEAHKVKIYEQIVRQLEPMVEKLTDELKDIQRLARANRKSSLVITRAAAAENLSQGLSALISAACVPDKHKLSHDRRDLAYKMLVQVSSDTSEYAISGVDETGEEAALGLSEVLRQLAELRASFVAER